jgi:S-adenosylmethionine synthetase
MAYIPMIVANKISERVLRNTEIMPLNHVIFLSAITTAIKDPIKMIIETIKLIHKAFSNELELLDSN